MNGSVKELDYWSKDPNFQRFVNADFYTHLFKSSAVLESLACTVRDRLKTVRSLLLAGPMAVGKSSLAQILSVPGRLLVSGDRNMDCVRRASTLMMAIAHPQSMSPSLKEFYSQKPLQHIPTLINQAIVRRVKVPTVSDVWLTDKDVPLVTSTDSHLMFIMRPLSELEKSIHSSARKTYLFGSVKDHVVDLLKTFIPFTHPKVYGKYASMWIWSDSYRGNIKHKDGRFVQQGTPYILCSQHDATKIAACLGTVEPIIESSMKDINLDLVVNRNEREAGPAKNSDLPHGNGTLPERD